MKGKWFDWLPFLLHDADATLAKVKDDSVVAHILAKDGDVSDFDDTTDSLEALAEYLQLLKTSGLAYEAAVTTATDTTHFKASGLAGLDSALLKNWYVYVLWDKDGAGAAPQNEKVIASAFDGSDGTVTHPVFTAALTVLDKVLMLHPAIGALLNTTYGLSALQVIAAAIQAKTDLILSGTKIVTKTSTSTLTTGTLFTWAGSVQILSIIGRVTTVIQGQATTVKLGIQADALTIQDICATLDISGFLVGSLLGITGSYTDAMIGTTGVPTKPPTTPINATCVTSGIIKVTYGAASTGAIVWEILWLPLNAAGSIVAA